MAEKESGHGHDSAHSSEKEKKETSYTMVYIVVFVIIVLWIMRQAPPIFPTQAEKEKKEAEKKSQTVYSVLAPAIEPLEFTIGPNISTPVSMAKYLAHYNWMFVCSEDYCVTDRDGNKTCAKKYENANIGFKEANQLLRFEAPNGPVVMRIEFTPKVIK